jgi:hypothetical protein
MLTTCQSWGSTVSWGRTVERVSHAGLACDQGRKRQTCVLSEELVLLIKCYAGMLVHEEGRFDPNDIPLRTWAEYEEDLWEQGASHCLA